MAEFVFQINEVGEDGGRFSWPVTSRWVRAEFTSGELKPATDGEIGKLAIDAYKNGDGILLRGHLTLAIHTPCVRCLGDAPLDVDTELVGMLALPGRERRATPGRRKHRGAPAQRSGPHSGQEKRPTGDGKDRGKDRDEDTDEDDTRLDGAMLVGDAVHLDPWVREHIVLEVPMRPVCGDDCNGLEVPAHIRPPEDFGSEQDVDPRLLPLLKLKDQFPSKKE